MMDRTTAAKPAVRSLLSRFRIEQENRVLIACVGFGAIFLSLFFSRTIHLVFTYSGNPISWSEALTVGLAQYVNWLLLSLAILWLTLRFPIGRRRWLLRSAGYLVIGLLLCFGKQLVDGLVILSFSSTVFMSRISSVFLMMFYYNLVTYGGIVGLFHAVSYYRGLQQREIKASRLEARLVGAQLNALKMQLHPHFLFNTLHTIGMLNLVDAKAANRMLVRLSDLLRLTLDNEGAQEVILKKELEFLDCYLEIQKIRFGDRLVIRMDIAPGTLTALVPNLMLQPLVENAVRHGIAPLEEGGEIHIASARQGDQLDLVVEDKGPGLAAGVKSGDWEGIGLANTKARLEQLYGDAQSFMLDSEPEKGLSIRIGIPYREMRRIPEEGN